MTYIETHDEWPVVATAEVRLQDENIKNTQSGMPWCERLVAGRTPRRLHALCAHEADPQSYFAVSIALEAGGYAGTLTGDGDLPLK
jgi:hypothetical protein